MFNCGAKVLPAVVHPTKCCVNHAQTNFIVPEIHPTHTTTVNHVNFQHQHYFPHTYSEVDEVTNTNIPMPGPGFGPGPAVMGAGMPGPGFGPGFGPGPQVMGVGMPGPGFGHPPGCGCGCRPRPGFGF